MHKSHTLPWAGLMIAAVAAVLLISAGVVVPYAIAVWVVWSLTLLISQPQEPLVIADQRQEGISRENLIGMIENAHSPLLLVDRKRVVIANASARALLGRHVIGQDVRVAIRHPRAIAMMNSDSHGEAIVSGLVRRKDVWRVSRFAVDDRTSVIELVSKTAESDVSRAHTDFVANASHELRTPLASIIGYVETLREDVDNLDPRMADKFLGTIQREAKRLQDLVSDLMSLSRIEAVKHDLPDTTLDLAKLAERAAHDAANGERLELLDFEATGEFPVRGDRQQLEQLVRNLVDNGFKYGEPGQTVTVRIHPKGDNRLRLTVTDRGEGIAAEHIPHLTRRFYRTDPGRSRASGGTGLGLAIVKHIVERHRGRLDIDSTPGEGTRVTVTLPLEKQDEDD